MSSYPIRATLAISAQEALSGGKRDLTLPDGRRISVVIPAGVQNGQVIRVDDPHMTGDASVTQLYLTLAVVNTPPVELNIGGMEGGRTTAQDVATVIHPLPAGATFEQSPTLPNEPQYTQAVAHRHTAMSSGAGQSPLPLAQSGMSGNAGAFITTQPS